MTGEVGIGLVGYGFMGRAHSNAYRQVGRFFDVSPKPVMRVICGRDRDAVASAAGRLGWQEHETDHERLLARDDVDVVDVCTPGREHHGIVLAALEAGKHVFCEKPLANDLEEAGEMLRAARGSGVVCMVNFNYRKVPAVALAKKLIEGGRIGTVRHWRAVYLNDSALDQEAPLTWRFRRELAGTGVLGDTGSHVVDLARHLVGEISAVVGLTETFVAERPLEGEAGRHGPVTTDDAAAFLVRFAGGATGTFETSRLAPGHKNGLRFEVNGSAGSIAFDLERMNELRVCFEDDAPDVGGFRTVMVTEPAHPYAGAWWPPGHAIGYEHTFVHAVKDLLDAVAAGESASPDFEDGYRCQAVLDAVGRSAESGRWAEVPGPDAAVAP